MYEAVINMDCQIMTKGQHDSPRVCGSSMKPRGETDAWASCVQSTGLALTEASLEIRISLRLMLSYRALKKSWGRFSPAFMPLLLRMNSSHVIFFLTCQPESGSI